MARWTRLVLRLRWPIIALWLVVILAGGYASTRLSPLLSNTFTVPGTDSEQARTILQQHFGDRSDGEFLIIYKVRADSPRLTAQLQRSIRAGATAVPGGRATALRVVPDDVVYGSILSSLNLAKAKGYTDDILRKLRPPPGVDAYVSGQAAIQHDLDPIFSRDLKKGESIAIPIALIVLLAVFGLSLATTMPFIFAAATITGTLGIVYVAAHYMTMATYVTNLVQLIGLGIAIDYSLLVVYRFREELQRGDSVDDAIVRTMRTAGRAVIFSGATVAIGLGLLLFMPLPFMRSMGVGGFLIPLVSIAGAATLQPALLSVYGRRGTARVPVADWLRTKHVPLPHLAGPDDEHGSWARLARVIMRRPVAFLVGGVLLLFSAAVPVFALQLTPGSAQGIPQSPQAVRGLNYLRAAVGPGALSPSQIVIDAGAGRSVQTPAVQSAISRMNTRLEADPEVAFLQTGLGSRFVDPTGRYEQVIVAGRHEYGDEPAQHFVSRLRHAIIPGSRFPDDVRVLAGGGPPQGVDFLHRSYSVFPWLVLAVLVLTYFLLMRAFRSIVLPLKAVILNLLSVAAAYGMLVVFFRWGLGHTIAGLYQFPQVEGWIPIFLFAMLFGLSMDYEVFLVSRMRETWDEEHDNVRAVSYGLERTGRIITAAAIVMVAAFSGFVAGSIVGLQEFGLGLAVAIFIDATIVRALLVPALMAIFGRWNWWLPARLARIVRVTPSPLTPPSVAVRPAGE
ncbi:MAG TPA: MMPL family transporter [Gaiellaceae bacterium]|nr:MMPL family transporter [Gaiellaceae bacterium]